MNSYASCEPCICDSHNHLHFDEFTLDLHEVLSRSLASGVREMLLVGIDPDDSARAFQTARQFAGLYASLGIHPQKAGAFSRDDVLSLADLAGYPEVVAIGETGFDLYRTPETLREQQELFAAHIDLARQLGLPLVIHDRQAHEQSIGLMNETAGWDTGGVFHCFSGDVALARTVVDRGFLVSIPGVVTFKNADTLRAVVRFCPLDSLLVETDAPYLAPVPHRGKRNEPSFVQHTLQELARIKGVSPGEAARATSDNFRRIFLSRGPA